MSFTPEEIEEFKAEALELLETAEKSLLALDEQAEFRPAFDAVFRCFHNLKGASGMMELLDLQAHTHELENIWMHFKEATSISADVLSGFLKGIDAARALLAGQAIQFDFSFAATVHHRVTPPPPVEIPAPIETGVAETEAADTLAIESEAMSDSLLGEFTVECAETIERVADALQLIEAHGHSKETLEALYRDVHSLKGSSYLFSFTALGDLAHAMESSLEGVRNGTHATTLTLINRLFECIKLIESELGNIKSRIRDHSLAQAIPAIAKALAEEANNLPLVNPIEPQIENEAIPMSIPEVKTIETSAVAPLVTGAVAKESDGNSSIRVSVSLLDNLMTLMGEMVLVRNQVLQFSSKSEDLEFLTLSKRLNVVTSEIQGEMMKTRMQPIGNILSKFSRVVRDLSQELKKEISLTLSGADTELDKSLLEAIKDPLTHIVRNSCDHGVETSEVRLKAGKPKGGNIHIRSFHEGGQVVIEVTDDGKGLHKDMLLRKALEKGLITQVQAASMPDKEVFNLIFAPGFSTAAAVTNVSGRGVGMDVVRTNVEKIGGSVELASVAGQGTTIKIKIPLTLAIVPALIIRCGGETFAIPQVKLEELVRVDQSSTENRIEYLHGTPVYRLRGSILPLVNLNKVLNQSKAETGAGDIDGVCNIAVLNADQGSFGVIVDEIQDTADIVVKPINKLLKSLQVYSGATILGDGSIALILDIQGISKVSQISSGKRKSDEVGGQKSEFNRNAELQEFLIVRLNSPTKHAIVLGYVHRLEEFKSSDVEFSGSQRVIRYGKTILPIISANEILGYQNLSAANDREVIPVVVIEKAGALYGIEVDDIVDTLSTSLEVDVSFVKQPGIFGNINTSDGLIVVSDPFEIIGLAYPETTVATARKSREDLPVAVETVGHRAAHILLVEDTVFFRRAVANVLEGAGYQVTVAVDGKQALEFIEHDPTKFNLVVSDIEMPRMNGFDLAKALKAKGSTAKIPMIALSSRADKNHTEQGLRAGFSIYLEKMKPKILLEAVGSLVDPQRKAG